MFDERGSTFTTIAVAVAVFAAVAVPAAALGSTVSPTDSTTAVTAASNHTATPNATETATANGTVTPTPNSTATATPNATETATPNATETATPTATPRMGTATISFTDQQAESSVTVDSVSLSEGGFVVIYNSSGSVVGVSEYLEAGDYEDLSIEVSPSFTMSEVAIAEVHYDANGDQSFDGTVDVAYQSAGTAVSGTAFVSPDGFSRSTDTATDSPTATATATATEADETTAATTSDESTDASSPGFTAALALVAIAGAVALGLRNR